jgi:hypothetical protein
MSKELVDELEELDNLLSDDSPLREKPVDPHNPVAPLKEDLKAQITKDLKPKLEKGQIPLVNFITDKGDASKELEFDDLDIALKEQSALYAYYAECTALAQKQLSQAKFNLEIVQARLDMQVRDHFLDEGKKVTEKVIEGAVKQNASYKNAYECLTEAQYIYKSCAGIVDAFHQREQMIIQTCKRSEIEMMMKNGMKSRDERLTEAMSKTKD